MPPSLPTPKSPRCSHPAAATLGRQQIGFRYEALKKGFIKVVSSFRVLKKVFYRFP